MTYTSLTLERQGGIAVVTLNRPASKNALNASLTADLTHVFAALSLDESVRVVVMTGAGGDFSAGGDLRDGAGGEPPTPEQSQVSMRRYGRLVNIMLGMDKPLIAAVDGVAYGGGLSLVLMSDIVLVSERVRMALVFHRIGLVPDIGAWYTLPRLVGLQRAKELMLSAREFNAQEAKDMGLALEIHKPESLLPRAMELARSFEGASATAVALTKRALNATLQSDLNTMLDMEASGQAVCLSSAYFYEAVRRFASKEPSQFLWPKRAPA